MYMINDEYNADVLTFVFHAAGSSDEDAPTSVKPGPGKQKVLEPQ